MLTRVGTKRFGPPEGAARARLAATGLAELARLTDRLFRAADWADLFAE